MNYCHIITQLKAEVLYVTLNRAPKLNALNKETLVELADVLAYAASAPEVKGLILTGAGAKAFVAGADIAEFADYSPQEGEALSRNGHQQVFDAIAHCPKPVIAAINGFALGGGLELALACHIRIASSNAKLGLPEVGLGLIPGYGGTQRLPKLVGKGKAMQMILTGDPVSADEALQMGLVNQVVEPENLMPAAEAMMDKIKQRAPLAISAAIKAINASEASDRHGFQTEIVLFGECFGTQDFKEGSRAFLEKRSPQFLGK